MKSKLWVGVLLGWQVLASAQDLAPEAAAVDVGAERQRISEERAGHESVYQQAERVCYSRFAVTDCLRDARKTQRLAMDELRHRELLLNDMERKTKALEALKRIEAKLATQQEKSLQNAPESANPP